MIKSMFKRGWLSITRKPSKTVILVIVMFVMANLVLASMAIKNAVGESTRFAKESLGSTVYLTADMEKVREAAHMDQDPSGGRMMVKLERPTVYLEMVQAIADSQYVKDYTYGINANAKEKQFTALDNNSYGGGMMTTGGGTSGTMSIIGINSYAFINEVQNKTMELIKGNYFDEKTNDQCIISNELAEANDLQVGDKIKLLNQEIDMENYDPRTDSSPKVLSSQTYEVEIIGIYDVNTDNFNGNTIYMNVETAAHFLKEDEYMDGNYGVDNIIYYLTNPEYVDAFIEEVNSKYPNLADDKLMLNVNTDDYEKMAGPIEQVGSFADTVLVIVVIASILIITLIINNNIKDRKYEIGVLMSLGGTKKNIVGGFLIELIVIGTVGFALSLGTSYFLADAMGKNLLEKQLASAEEQSENNYGRPGAGGMGGNRQGGVSINSGSGGMYFNINGASDVTAISDIDISISGTDYCILFLIGYLIAGIAMIIPAINIVKYEPKTILTGRQ